MPLWRSVNDSVKVGDLLPDPGGPFRAMEFKVMHTLSSPQGARFARLRLDPKLQAKREGQKQSKTIWQRLVKPGVLDED